MKDVMVGLNLMQDRCDGMVASVQERIHAMGVEHDWDRLYPEGDDPFKPLKPDRMPTPEARKQEASGSSTTEKPERSSTTEGSSTETTWSYRSIQDMPVHTLHRIGTTAMHPRLEYHASHGVGQCRRFLIKNTGMRCKGTLFLGKCVQFWTFSGRPQWLLQRQR